MLLLVALPLAGLPLVVVVGVLYFGLSIFVEFVQNVTAVFCVFFCSCFGFCFLGPCVLVEYFS